MVRAKFLISSKEEILFNGSKAFTIKANPVYGGKPDSENGKFFAATPSGVILLSIVRSEVAAAFEVGDEFYVDFTKAEKPAT